MKCSYCQSYTDKFVKTTDLEGHDWHVYRCEICEKKEDKFRNDRIEEIQQEIDKLESQRNELQAVDYEKFEERIKSLDWLKEKKFVLGDRDGEYVLCFYAKDDECHQIVKNYYGEIELMSNGEKIWRNTVYLKSDGSLSCDGTGFKIRSTSLDLFTKFIKTYKPKIYLDKEYVEQKIEYNKALLELCDDNG